MMKGMSPEKRTQMMLGAPVSRVIPRLAIPTIISMLITAIYNMADTFFVSQIGTSASGAVGVIFSAMAIIQAVSFMMGMGTGTNVSQALGAGDEERARRYAAVGFFSAFGLGVVLAILGLSNIDVLVRFLGATETIAPYAKDYATYIFYATPFMMCSFVMNNLLRFEGLAMYGMVGISTGGILNMILDPIFIFVLGLGTSGAAIATAISQFVSFSILLFMCNTKPDAITIDPRNFKPTAKMYGRILYIGFPSLGRQGIASISTILLNTAAGVHGDAAIAAMSIVTRFIMFINSSIIGFGQGFQPVCGFSYGAGKYSRVREAFWFCVKVATVLLVVLGGTAMLFSEQIVTVFRRDDAEVIRIGTLALRLQLSTIPLWGFIVMSNMLTQSIGYGARATLLSVARQGIFLIPALLVLPGALGLIGIQIAQPISDVCTLVLTIVIMTGVLRQLKSMPDKA
ncbi:MAG: MATE family efflux transporter [Clostridiales bacterium]|nr:MATE family efflux transporter [Clostridiales bacterium]